MSDWGGRGHWFGGRYTYDMSLYDACDAAGNPLLTAVRPKPNTTVFSLENELNHFDALNPALPSDVVWRDEGNGGVSAEIDFDDYLRNNALIIAPMNAAIDIRCQSGGVDGKCSALSGPPRFSNGRILDGFVPEGDPWAGSTSLGWNSKDRFAKDPTLQNTVTSSVDQDPTAITPPSSLRLRGGARVEPINAGGVRGRGVYLDGQNDIIDAAYPYQANRTEWSLGVWLDARDLATLRTVFFPDESSIAIKGNRIVAHDGPRQTRGFGGVEQTITLASGLITEGKFFHLGLKLTTENDERVLRFTINGTPLAQPLSFAHLRGGGDVDVPTVDPGPIGGKELGELPGSIPLKSPELTGEITAPEKLTRETTAPETMTVAAQAQLLSATEASVTLAKQQPIRAPEPGYDVPLGFQLMKAGSPNGYTWFALAGCTTDWNPPFKGWVDELKVFSLGASELANTDGFFDELLCNQALGTQVDVSVQPGEVPGASLSALRARLAEHGYTYPGSGVAGPPVRAAVCEQLDLVPDGNQGKLPAQHDGDTLCAHRVHKNQTSNRCLRGAALGLVPLQAQAPLPSFSSDAFCLGCHHAGTALDGLGLAALAAGVVPSEQDARRRPMFWPAVVTGNQYDLPFGPTNRLAGWDVCDPGTQSCTALDRTFDPANHRWFLP